LPQSAQDMSSSGCPLRLCLDEPQQKLHKGIMLRFFFYKHKKINHVQNSMSGFKDSLYLEHTMAMACLALPECIRNSLRTAQQISNSLYNITITGKY